MIERDVDTITLTHPDATWSAVHRTDSCAGPAQIRVGAVPVLRDCAFYVDDLHADAAVVTQLRAFRRGGTAVVASAGHFPIGAELAFRQTCRYAANHVRVTFDLRWRRGASANRT